MMATSNIYKSSATHLALRTGIAHGRAFVASIIICPTSYAMSKFPSLSDIHNFYRVKLVNDSLKI